LIALAEPEFADQVGRDVNVLFSREVAADTQEPVALRKDVKQSFPDFEFALVDRLLAVSPAALAVALAGATVTIRSTVTV
jgi:hypothetical protein